MPLNGQLEYSTFLKDSIIDGAIAFPWYTDRREGRAIHCHKHLINEDIIESDAGLVVCGNKPRSNSQKLICNSAQELYRVRQKNVCGVPHIDAATCHPLGVSLPGYNYYCSELPHCHSPRNWERCWLGRGKRTYYSPPTSRRRSFQMQISCIFFPFRREHFFNFI